ncbi:MAG TPA: hypothetical protein VFE99_06085, partial [Agromyces sp.]|nr:hypothetical protein [Agromyces sp.]
MRSLGLDLSTVRGRCRAYLPLLGSKVFSHTTAALLHGIPLPLELELEPAAGEADAHLHVSSIGGTRPRGDGIVGHELVTASVVLVEELPVVSAAETWCQLAATVDREHLVAAGDFLLSGTRLSAGRRTRPLCTRAELEDSVRRHGRRPGAPALRWALPRLRTGVDSVPETLLRLAIAAGGLAEPVIGHAIAVADGSVVHPDLAYPDARIVIEYEGDRHRTDKQRFRRDIRRYRRMEDAGWRVIRVAGTEPADLEAAVASI